MKWEDSLCLRWPSSPLSTGSVCKPGVPTVSLSVRLFLRRDAGEAVARWGCSASADRFFVYPFSESFLSGAGAWVREARVCALALPAQASGGRRVNSVFTELQVVLEGSAEAVGVRGGALEEAAFEGRRVSRENTGEHGRRGPSLQQTQRPAMGGAGSLKLARVLRAIRHRRSRTQPVGVHRPRCRGVLSDMRREQSQLPLQCLLCPGSPAARLAYATKQPSLAVHAGNMSVLVDEEMKVHMKLFV